MKCSVQNKLYTCKEIVISAIIWVVGVITFGLVAGIVLLLTLLFEPRTYDNGVKLLCRIFLKIIFIRVQVEGIEKIDRHKTYLFICNHVNIFDVFVLTGYIPNFVRGVELEDHFHWPVYGWVIKRLGTIPISQQKARSAMRSLHRAKEALKNGTSIIILPEGGRTLDGQLKPFQRGAFLLAKMAAVDMVPMAMVGAFQIKRKGSAIIRPGTMRLRFGEIIPFEKVKDLSTEALRDLVRSKIEFLISA